MLPVLAVPAIDTPGPVLPEMMLRASNPVPPITLPVLPAVINIPSALAMATVPAALVPIWLPSTMLLVVLIAPVFPMISTPGPVLPAITLVTPPDTPPTVFVVEPLMISTPAVVAWLPATAAEPSAVVPM